MDSSLDKFSATVVVIDPVSSRRVTLSDVIRAEGFDQVNPFPSGKDLLRYLEVETPSWIILPLQTGDEINAIQILSILSKRTRFVGTRISLMVTPEEYNFLPLAFEMGLLSWHKAVYSRDELESEIKTLLNKWEAFGRNTALVAADYLHNVLIAKGAYQQLQTLYHHLLDLFPGNAKTIVRLGEVKLMAGQQPEGHLLLHQAELLDPSLKPSIDPLRQKYLPKDTSKDSSRPYSEAVPTELGQDKINILGITTCVVIDPDSSIQHTIENLLRSIGVPDIQIFSSGKEAWRWMKVNPVPGLILQEWRLPELTGPLLLQRLRQDSHYKQVTVVIVSSLIKKSDSPLLLEMGVSALIEKPFDQDTFFRTVISALQQQRCPSEQGAIERKMYQLLEASKLQDALKLLTQFEEDPRISAGAKTAMQAAMAFYQGEYIKARDLSLAALRGKGDSLLMLNLLGKCLLKTGQAEASLKCFSRAQEISPSNLDRLCRMAEAEADLGNSDAAAELLSRAKAIDPSSDMVLSTEAGLALTGGDLERAASVIGQLESMSRLVAFMNNRAIALTLSGRFEEGIDLYSRTLEALPEPWGYTQDAIVYNLGLAYARHGNLEGALKALKRIQQLPSTPLGKKADAMRMRIDKAKRTGEIFVLSSPLPLEHEKSKKSGTEKSANADQTESLNVTLEVRQGDSCLHFIYHAIELAPSEVKSFIKELPAFRDREPGLKAMSSNRPKINR